VGTKSGAGLNGNLRPLNGRYAGHGLTVARDDDLFAVLDAVDQLTQMGLCFGKTNSAHNAYD